MLQSTLVLTPFGHVSLRSFSILTLIFCGVLCIASAAFADFREPLEITESPDDSAGVADDPTAPHVACDGGDQLAIVFQRGDELIYAKSANRFENFDLTFGAEVESGPLRAASSSDGDFVTLYIEDGECRLKNDPAFLVLSSTLSTDGIDCFHVDCDGALEDPGEVAMVWQEGEGDDAQVYLRNGAVSAEFIDDGEIPAVHVSEVDNYTHIVYRRDGGLYYEQWAYGDTEQSLDATIPTPAGDEDGIAIAAYETSTDYIVYAVYRNDGKIYYSMMDDAVDGFQDEVEIGESSETPSLALKSDGELVLAYVLDGIITIIDGFLGDDPTNHELTDLDSGAGEISIAVDVRDQIHVCYVQDGAVYYTNDFSDDDAPVADFSAAVTSGQVPLTVEFDELSTGVVWYVDWEFGNDADSDERSPVSTLYGEVGSYSVTLTVTGPGGEDSLTLVDYVTTTEASYSMRLPELTVAPGDTDVTQYVFGTMDTDTSGYAIALAFDADETDVTELSVEDTDSGALEPEFESTSITLDGADSYAVLGVVYETIPPFDGTLLEQGTDVTLARLVYDVSEDVELGLDLAIRLQNELSDPPINNGYSVDLGSGEETKLAYLYNPGVRTHSLLSFMRGDTNLNGILTLADPLIGLTYAFGLAGEPDCLDAADSNDDGGVNILDGLFTLTFMFQSGPEPPAPYPDAGLDPTDDDLADCMQQ